MFDMQDQTEPQGRGAVDDSHDAATRAEARAVAWTLLAVVLGVAAWGGAVALWGMPGLYLPALALVPVIWALLLIISRV